MYILEKRNFGTQISMLGQKLGKNSFYKKVDLQVRCKCFQRHLIDLQHCFHPFLGVINITFMLAFTSFTMSDM